jgi:ATP-binding cassette, subfamily C (CFTR/MRP), member 1
VQSHLNSVERIMYCAHTCYSPMTPYYLYLICYCSDANEADQEPPHFIPDKKPAPQWPQEGRIRFEDVVLTYRADLGPTLKGLTASIKAGEKIGIIGRTGAGKSSIMVALYRIVELSGGKIVIDDIDVGTIGLNDLRSKIASKLN